VHFDGHFTLEGLGPILFIYYFMILGGNTKYQQKTNEKMEKKNVVHTLTLKKVKGTPIL
jgi:hypothetical protein